MAAAWRRLLGTRSIAHSPTTLEPDVPPSPQPDLYQVVAARRLQWATYVWEAPVLGLTAQAFLFTIALGSGVSALARISTAALIMATSFASIVLMARHRQAELADAEWLIAYERKHFGVTILGPDFRQRREAIGVVGRWRPPAAFGYWIALLSAFGVVGFPAMVAAVVAAV